MNNRKEESAMPLRFIRSLLIGLIVGAVTILTALLVLSAIATAYDIPSAIVVPLATVANALGAFASGFASSRTNKRNGWFLGSVSALVLFVFSTAAGLGIFSESNGSFMLIKALIMLACGLVGGIFGLNSGKQHKKR